MAQAGSTRVGGVYFSIEGEDRDFKRAMRDAQNSARRTGNVITTELKKSDIQAQRLNRSLTGIRGNIAGLVSGASLGLLTVAAGKAADNFALMRSRIRLAIDASDDLLKVEKDLYDQSLRNRADLEATVALYARVRQAQSDLTDAQAQAITDAWSKTLLISGASAQEASAATIQFAQAIASGTLRGDELRSILENNVRFSRLLADNLGITVGQLRKLGEEGKLTSDVLIDVLVNRAGKVNEEFGQIPLTIGQAMQNVQTAFTRYIGTADQASGTSEKLAGFINSIASDFDRLAEVFVVASATIGGALAGLAAVKIVSGLVAITTTAQGAASAMVTLRSAMAFFGGPVGLAVIAVAGSLAYLAATAKDVDDYFNDANRTLSQYVTTQQTLADDTELLKQKYEDLNDAISAAGTTAQDAANLEIDAINRRIEKNRELLNTYRDILNLQVADARAAVSRQERKFLSMTGVKRNEDAGVDQFGQPLVETFASAQARQSRAAEEMLKSIREKIANQTALNDQERAFYEAYTELQDSRASLASLEETLANLGKTPDAPSNRSNTPTTPISLGGDTETDAQRQKRLRSLDLMQREQEIAVALAAGDFERARILQDQLEIQRRINEYEDLKLSTSEAQSRAYEDVVNLKELERQATLDQRALEQEIAVARASGNDDLADSLQRVQDIKTATEELIALGLDPAAASARATAEVTAIYEGKQKAKVDKQFEEMRDRFAGYISDGLTEAIKTGDWGSSVKEIFARSVSEALSDAINNFATQLVNILTNSGGNSLFSGISNFFGFGGARAGGGSVSPLTSYIVGESGPELFVPGVSGAIIPNDMITPKVDTGAFTGRGAVYAPFIVQGNVTEEVMPRVQQMFAEFVRQLPSAIDARVLDRQSRGAY